MSRRIGDSIKARVLRASVRFQRQPFIRPLLLSSGAIESITQADAEGEVEVGGERGVGRGCIYLSDLWAWPDPSLDHAARDEAMRSYTASFAAELPRLVMRRPIR